MNVSLDKFLGGFGQILSYLNATLGYTVIIFILSLLFGVVLALLNMSKSKFLKSIIAIWVSIYRGTPILAQLFFFIYGFFPLLPGGNNISLTVKFVIVMVLSYSAYMSETVRGAIESIDKGQMEGCLSIGMTNGQAMIRVILPQAAKVAIPALSNTFLDVLKGTSLGTTVGIVEMLGKAKMMAAFDYHFLEYYTCIMIIFWVLNMVFTKLQKILEAKLATQA